MKKIYLSLIAIVFAINFSYAQWTTGPGNINNTNSGNVGIGTTSPVETLDVIGTVKANSLNVKGSTSVEVAALTGTGMGYAPTTYPVSAVGILSGSGVTSIGYNPLTNTGGNFTGNGSEVLFRNTVKFIQPNAGGTDYLSPTMTLNNGNVGIGNTSPAYKLEVNGTGNFSGAVTGTSLALSSTNAALSLTNTGPSTAAIFSTFNNTGGQYQLGADNSGGSLSGGALSYGFVMNAPSGRPIVLAVNNAALMTVLSSGNVGIGTTGPSRLLDIEQNSGSLQLRLGRTTTAAGYFDIGADVNNLNFFNQAGSDVMVIGQNGNVGIGTTSPDQKLTVKGNIHSQEVVVDMNVLPDYVFKPAYHLPTLTEIKTYIDQNHHLPEMPSAEQVAKDGLGLGDMNAKLLKKVEELTLYLIEKDKENKEIHKELDKLKQQVSTLIKSKP